MEPATGTHFCEFGGYLVSADMVVTDDPSDYQKGGSLLGCNQLRCVRCDQLVRHRAGVDCPNVSRRLVQLAETADWATLEFLRPYATARLYACRCSSWRETSYHFCSDPDPEPDPTGGRPNLPWSCGGHPVATMPVDIDGEQVAADTDLDAMVVRVLSGWSPDRSPQPCPWSPSAWLYRVRARLADLPIAQALALAVSRRLDDRELRAGALAYFCGYPRDAGFDQVVRVAADPAVLHDRTLNRAKSGPGTLYWPAWALRCRLFSVRGELDDLDRAALALLQQSWLRGDPGLVREDLDAIACADAPWIAASAAAIARADTTRALPLLACLREREFPELVAIAGVALAGEPAMDRDALRVWLDQWFNRSMAYVAVIQRALASP